MKKLLLSLTLLFAVVLTNAQEQEVEHDYRGSFILNWAPLSAFDSYSRLRLGAEIGVSQRASVGLDVGFNLSNYEWGGYAGGWDDREYSVFEVRPEIKFFFNDKYRARLYNALEFYYIYLEEELEDDYYYKDKGEIRIDFDEATYTKAKFGAHYKFGVSLRMGSRMVFDPYVGVGVRLVEREYVDVIGGVTNPDNSGDWDEWLWSDSQRYEGNFWGVNFSGGFRLGIYLAK
ncbi:hypothetical protein [Carboxylicivirga sp. RSCT41]|uniref:hypothetical protein n=1 Tax=Carboxylicivirga agarovorans TaxID=3417570 RepID=UPI003D3330BA